MWKGLNIKLQQFVTIFCWNIYHQTCRCLFCLFTFWKEKKCNPVLIHDCLFFLIHDRHREYICIIRIQLYWRYPVRTFMPLAVVKQKLRYRGSFAPSLFPPPPPPPHTHTHPKRRFKKPTRNRVTNMIIDKANLEILKVFCVQTLLRQYAPCEHNSIDEVWYSSQGLIKTLQNNQVNKL